MEMFSPKKISECHQHMVSNKWFGFKMAIAFWKSNLATGSRHVFVAEKTCSTGINNL